MIDIKELKFDEKGLIPAIVVDAVTKRVLTLAYMNEESLRISMEKKLGSRIRLKITRTTSAVTGITRCDCVNFFHSSEMFIFLLGIFFCTSRNSLHDIILAKLVSVELTNNLAVTHYYKA